MTDLRQLPSNQAWDQTSRVILNTALKDLSGVPATITTNIATHNADSAAHTAAFTTHKAASNTWSNTNNFTGDIQSNGVSIVPFGKQKMWIPSEDMRPATTNGPAAADVTATEVQYYVLDFDQTTAEIAHFTISFPSRWDGGTVTFVPIWTAAAGTGGVVWVLNGAAASDDDVIAATYSGQVTSTDTLIATGDLHRGPESSGLTIDGTPADNDAVFFRLRRSVNAASDTLTADARLIGIELYWTADAAVDVA